MSKTRRAAIGPVLIAALAGVALAGCSTYGAGDYRYGRSYSNYGYGSPYSYGRGTVYVAPRGYDPRHYGGYDRYRAYPSGHNGFGHLGGRRH